MRSEITETIAEIPFTIDMVFRISRVYDTDAMQSHVSQLFVAILELLQECLRWLTRNPFRKGFSAMVKGADHAAGLSDKRKQLDRLTEKVDKYAMAELHETARETNESKSLSTTSERSGLTCG